MPIFRTVKTCEFILSSDLLCTVDLILPMAKTVNFLPGTTSTYNLQEHLPTSRPAPAGLGWDFADKVVI